MGACGNTVWLQRGQKATRGDLQKRDWMRARKSPFRRGIGAECCCFCQTTNERGRPRCLTETTAGLGEYPKLFAEMVLRGIGPRMERQMIEARTQEPDDGETWVPLGEAASEGDIHLAAVLALYERGIESHWVIGGTDVDEVRRVLEPETGGQRLMVAPRDVERACGCCATTPEARVLFPRCPHLFGDEAHGGSAEDSRFSGHVVEADLERRLGHSQMAGAKTYPPDAVSSKQLPFSVPWRWAWCSVRSDFS